MAPLYRCAGPLCPGLPFQASELPHPPSCVAAQYSPARGLTTVAHVIDSSARHFGVTRLDLIGRRRNASTAWARGVAMFLARALTDCSYPELARRFGGKHHTSVIWAVQRVGRLLETDERTRADVRSVLRILEVRLSGLEFHGEAP